MTSDLLRMRPATTPAMLVVFDDALAIRHGLAFECALARAQADAELLSPDIAETIAAACATLTIDPRELADAAALAGTLAIPLVARLRASLDGEAALAVHRGATSQDVADSILMMQAKDAARLLLADTARIGAALAPRAGRYATMPALGRTLLQDALPIGFGLRIAQWHAGIQDAAGRVSSEIADNARLQLGGSTGTRAGLGGRGAIVAARMAEMLGLAAGTPWHGRRIGIGGIAAALGILIGALAKMARDVSLLAQNAVGEAQEPAIAGRGGSSAMAHKRNPTGCQIALSAAMRAPGLVASILAALPQESERGLGGWQAEGPVLADLFLLAAGSAEAMAIVAEGLEIDEAVIAHNLAVADVGSDIGESQAIVAALLDPRRTAR